MGSHISVKINYYTLFSQGPTLRGTHTGGCSSVNTVSYTIRPLYSISIEVGAKSKLRLPYQLPMTLGVEAGPCFNWQLLVVVCLLRLTTCIGVDSESEWLQKCFVSVSIHTHAKCLHCLWSIHSNLIPIVCGSIMHNNGLILSRDVSINSCRLV